MRRRYLKMAKTKYGQYVIQHPINYKGDWGAEVWYTGENDYKSNFTELFIRVTRDMVVEEYSHAHDFDMYVWVLPLDPNNLDDLGAEVEIGFRYGIGKTHCHLHAKFLCPQ